MQGGIKDADGILLNWPSCGRKTFRAIHSRISAPILGTFLPHQCVVYREIGRDAQDKDTMKSSE